MQISDIAAVVTGGASGLGGATAAALAAKGAQVFGLDLASSIAKADSVEGVTLVEADVTDEDQVRAAIAQAAGAGPLRMVVNCAGVGTAGRILSKNGPHDLALFRSIIDINLVGTFNVLRLASARMSAQEPVDGERGVCVLTASVAAWEGQIGQIPYASAKAGVVGMTLVAARDLSRALVRVCSIAPGVFDTPILSRFSDEIKAGLAAQVPHPARLGQPAEFASTAMHIIDNPMLNGETIRLDGAIRMAPR
jgi:NAD(P)-dependent dehydrogenase (short-subunit alcohol dehydrogenase family)